MYIEHTSIPDVKIIHPKVFNDERGFFLESYNSKKLNEYIPYTLFVQDNHSRSLPGVLRGIHFQIKKPQGKLIRVVRGEIYDVAVDLRKESKTFGQYVGVELSEVNKKMLWIPPGFGHGFLVTNYFATDVLYKTTEYWYQEYDRTLLWNDPIVNIKWPLGNRIPDLSEKDTKGLTFLEIQNGRL